MFRTVNSKHLPYKCECKLPLILYSQIFDLWNIETSSARQSGPDLWPVLIIRFLPFLRQSCHLHYFSSLQLSVPLWVPSNSFSPFPSSFRLGTCLTLGLFLQINDLTYDLWLYKTGAVIIHRWRHGGSKRSGDLLQDTLISALLLPRSLVLTPKILSRLLAQNTGSSSPVALTCFLKWSQNIWLLLLNTYLEVGAQLRTVNVPVADWLIACLSLRTLIPLSLSVGFIWWHQDPHISTQPSVANVGCWGCARKMHGACY